jgi:alpha-beta hydrolase superfamily lysophospholipase
MGLALFSLIVAAAVVGFSAGTWLACALWLRMRTAPRAAAAILLPLLGFGVLLWSDGAPFNGVVFALFLAPLLGLETAVVVLLERRWAATGR